VTDLIYCTKIGADPMTSRMNENPSFEHPSTRVFGS
jgi:hypothetical protein